ncbi:putative colanic acid biosynthesis protein [Salmonella enterica subsp. enterica serovar Agona str. 632182-2]|nr:putative colanic acid biosynthesis protein [Salmonella enterica subsp. enterica serovar Agona str. 632182-2]
MSRSIRICSYLLLPLIYLLVNVKIAQLGESFPITIVTFLPLLLLLFVERISVKKLMIALGIGAGLTAFNFLFGQSLNAGKYVTSTMLFVYIVVIIGMVWSIRFKTISAHNHRKILRFFIWWWVWWSRSPRLRWRKLSLPAEAVLWKEFRNISFTVIAMY